MMKLCVQCETERPAAEFKSDGRTLDGLARFCGDCAAQRVSVRARNRDVRDRPAPRRGKPVEPEAAPSAPAPGPRVAGDPWAGVSAKARGPFTVRVVTVSGGPHTREYAACSRACADEVLATRVPRSYDDVRRGFGGYGYRAIDRPARAVVAVASRGGACAGCSREVAALPTGNRAFLAMLAE